MYILGLSCYYHDAAAALLHDGMLIAASAEERFSRKKHDHGFPLQAIQFCLNVAGIQAGDLDYVVFYEKPLLKFERILLTTLSTFPRSYPVFRESMVAWFNQKLWIKSQIQTEIGIDVKKILFVEHHLSHAASAMFASPYKEAAVLTVDGVGEWTTAAIGYATAKWDEDSNVQNQINLTRELRFPHSVGLLYSAFTAFLGFRVNNGEYKVMGMAPYGSPNYVEEILKVVDIDDEGSVHLNLNYFSFHYSTQHTYNNKFTDIFGPPRQPDSEFYTLKTHPNRDHPNWDEQTAQLNQKYADIAASIQYVTEEIVLKMARYAHGLTGHSNLVMAGGVALNSVANGRIVREGPFENVFIQPAAGDAGGALGAALYVYHVILNRPRQFVMEHAYWGASYSVSRQMEAIRGLGLQYQEIEDTDILSDQVVSKILDGKVVSLYQGRGEWGPRALGNRSIIADPRQLKMKEIVNTKIKFREPFRPFAPVILAEQVNQYFSGSNLQNQYLPRYMQMVAPILEDKQEQIQAVCHNGTGRLQAIRQESNPFYYQVIEKFGEATGIPILLNTSYNLRGEPIVNTPEDALRTFAYSDIDLLVMGNFLVSKSNKPQPVLPKQKVSLS
ncbi:carbamoyltransferase family protein [Moorena producens]|uniref:carbamoyltransferase family protein n=1 Tax=Moorena producens TaxID=1155739 RepID=UPI003C7369EB